MPTTGRAILGNLPAEMTSFVGRRQELGEVNRLLSESRLVTLVGVGGTGKTRLAVRVGAQLRRAFEDGVWFVDLTELHGSGMLGRDVQDPDVLAFVVTASLGLRERSSGPPLELLAEQLADWQALLVLDNCEHLLPTTAILADALLRGCPQLRILATSREPLGTTGEILFPVPPLPIPDPGHRPGLAELGRYEAVKLFLARAQAIEPSFGLTAANQVAVADLCYRLDGLPLAIELAAARVRVLAPQQILDRLADRFTLLSRGSRSAPQRQQTLQACVDWSFDLCTKRERLLWARLSVFADGFELDAVEGVCADELLPETDLLELAAGLMDKSILVRVDVQEGRPAQARFRMLETIRDYGEKMLIDAGEDLQLRRRHRDWHQELAARARAEGVGDRPASWLARLGREHANLRAAIEFCLTEPGEVEAALRLAVTVPRLYWRGRGLFGEGRRWLDQALAQVTEPTVLRARALLLNCQLAFWQGDAATGRRLLDEGEELARRLDAAAVLAHATFLRAMGAMYANDLAVAVETTNRARTLLSGAPDSDLYLYLNVLNQLGMVAGLAGDHERASACVREALAIVEPRGGGIHRSLVLWTDGLVTWLRGDLRQAAAHLVESLRLKRASGSDDRYGTALCVEVLAWVTADQQRHRRAATLLGAAEALWTEIGTSITAFGHLIGRHAACERQIRAVLGDAAFADAFHDGRELAVEDVFAYAVEEPRRTAPASQKDTPPPLTRREQQVAYLIAQGLSNKEIATTLVVSQRTVETHVEHILTKLRLNSRAQVAAYIRARRSDGWQPGPAGS